MKYKKKDDEQEDKEGKKAEKGKKEDNGEEIGATRCEKKKLRKKKN